MATAAVAVGLLVLGALLVWWAWRSSQRHDAGRWAAGPIGVTGGVVVLAGVTVGVSGLASPAGVVGVAVAAAALVVGLVAAVRSADRGASRT